MRSFLCAAIVGLGVSATQAQLLIPNSTTDTVMMFDAFDGSLMNASFIDLAPASPVTPINAVPVGNEIWITDQLGDKIMRWSSDGTTYLGDITGGFDNIRGMEVVGDTAYVSNAGTSNGAPGEGVVTVDVPSMTISGSFTVGDDDSGDPFDVLFYQDKLLINDIDGDDLELHSLTGAWESTFHDSDGVSGINFPEQMSLTSAGTILVGGFTTPSGVYEFDSSGNQINYWDLRSSVRGVWELGNGDILVTTSGGVSVLDPTNGSFVEVFDTTGARFIEPIPEPASLMLLAIGAGLALRRRS